MSVVESHRGAQRTTPSEQEKRCVGLACGYLQEHCGGVWPIPTDGDERWLDKHPDLGPRPEVVVTNGMKTAAIEVKRLRGHSDLQTYHESLLSLSRLLLPSCGGSYAVMPPDQGFHLPMPRKLIRQVAGQIEEVAPALSVGESGILKMSRQGYIVFRPHPTFRDAHCMHDDGRSLLRPLTRNIPGDLFLIDERDPGHSFINEDGKLAFLATLESAWRDGRCSAADILTWNEQWQITKTYEHDESGDEVAMVAASNPFNVRAAVEECLDVMLGKALTKFRGRRWADTHIVVLEVETAVLSAERWLPVIAALDAADLPGVDVILLLDGRRLHQAYPPERASASNGSVTR